MFDFLDEVGDFFLDFVSSVGEFVASTVTSWLEGLSSQELDVLIEVVKCVSTVIVAVAETIGIITEQDKPDEMGAKIMQDGTRQRGENETAKEYMEYLRNVELDNEAFLAMREEEKVKHEILGTALITEGINETEGVEISSEFLATISKANLNSKDVQNLIKAFKANEIDSLDKVPLYFENKLTMSDAKLVGKAIEDSVKLDNPELSDEEIKSEVYKLKCEYNDNQV